MRGVFERAAEPSGGGGEFSAEQFKQGADFAEAGDGFEAEEVDAGVDEGGDPRAVEGLEFGGGADVVASVLGAVGEVGAVWAYAAGDEEFTGFGDARVVGLLACILGESDAELDEVFGFGL